MEHCTTASKHNHAGASRLDQRSHLDFSPRRWATLLPARSVLVVVAALEVAIPEVIVILAVINIVFRIIVAIVRVIIVEIVLFLDNTLVGSCKRPGRPLLRRARA